jgi:hypothetical protein
MIDISRINSRMRSESVTASPIRSLLKFLLDLTRLKVTMVKRLPVKPNVPRTETPMPSIQK